MRIALVSPGYPPTIGGVEVVVARTARALVRAGHSVEVLAAEQRRDLPAIAEDDGVVVRRFPASHSNHYPVAPGLWRHVRRNGRHYDVLHGHSYHSVAALGATLSTGTRFVFSPHYHGTGHSPLRAALHRAYRPIGRISFRRAASVVCVSRAEAELVGAHFPETTARIAVVPNAVDVEDIRAAEPFSSTAAEPPVLLSVGRLERYKRIDRLIRAIGALSVPATLVVIGDGPDRARLMELAAQHTKPDTVRFLGRIDTPELRRWLRSARALVSLSEHEAFGLAPAEALIAGADVLLSDIPAHAELIAAEADRLVGARETDVALAARLSSLLAAPTVPQHTEVLDWDAVAARLLDVYSGQTGT